jgi:hypothetical protein
MVAPKGSGALKRLFSFSAMLAALCVGCGDPPSLTAKATPWAEADDLFKKDPRWLGGDGAYSVDLGGGRTLWLFGDSFIATSDAGTRQESRLIRNSVAIQTGYDPTTASMEFFWRSDQDEPLAFFPAKDGVWYWPGDGERIGDKLVLFMMSVRAAERGLGFEVFDSDAFIVENPDDVPSAWVMRELELPSNLMNIVVGSASVFAQDGFLYTLGAREPGPHNMYLIRYPLPASGEPDLTKPEHLGMVFEDGQVELTMHYHAPRNAWMSVQTQGFGVADLGFRTAKDMRGPWSDLELFYRPPEAEIPDAMIYAGKAHPQIEGAELVVTYASNNFEFSKVVENSSIYYPRFVRMTFGEP